MAHSPETCRRRGLQRLLLAGAGALAWAPGLLSGCAQGHGPAAPHAWRRLAPGLWWAPAVAAEPDAFNRGQVAHLLAVRAGPALWLLGSGPSPALGLQLRQGLERLVGQPVSDLVNPWAHPALVLGNRAFLAPGADGAPPARLWAHADVATALQRQCPRCVQRLRAQLGAAAGDLGEAPVALPTRHLQGMQGLQGLHGQVADGRLHWWRVDRGAGSVTTVWAVPALRWMFAPGLLWTGAPPDLADSHLPTMLQATHTLLQRLGAGWQVLGQQGPAGRRAEVQAQAHYLAALADAVRRRQDAGALETEAAPPLAGVDLAWLQHPRHALNWQRAWRQLEDGDDGHGRGARLAPPRVG